jgi:hypothetical protein
MLWLPLHHTVILAYAFNTNCDCLFKLALEDALSDSSLMAALEQKKARNNADENDQYL